MKVQFFNREDEADIRNGRTFDSSTDAVATLNGLDKSTAFFCELVGENGYNLLLGLSANLSSAQYARADGAPPYMMAVRPSDLEPVRNAEFLIGGIATPVPGCYCLPLQLGLLVAKEFVETGHPSDTVGWKEI